MPSSPISKRVEQRLIERITEGDTIVANDSAEETVIWEGSEEEASLLDVDRIVLHQPSMSHQERSIAVHVPIEVIPEGFVVEAGHQHEKLRIRDASDASNSESLSMLGDISPEYAALEDNLIEITCRGLAMPREQLEDQYAANTRDELELAATYATPDEIEFWEVFEPPKILD